MLQETFATEIEHVLARYDDPRSAVLPLLYIAQDHYGPLTPEIIQEVADILGMPYTQVFEVVGFYTLFYDHPFGTWMIQVCDDVPCCYLGAEELLATLKEKLNVREDQPTADGMFTIQRVKCLATCQRPPVVQANLSYFYDVTAERADDLLNFLRQMADSPQASSVSGTHAEDYEPAANGAGGFQKIERLLVPYTPGTAQAAAPAAEPAPEAPAEPAAEPAPEAPAEPAAEPEPEISAQPGETPKKGFWDRLRGN